MKSISERLQSLSEALGVSLGKLSEDIGCDRSMFVQMKKSKNGIPSEYIAELSQLYPDINVRFLVTGEGEPLMSMELTEEQISASSLLNNIERCERDLAKLKELVEPMRGKKIRLK